MKQAMARFWRKLFPPFPDLKPVLLNTQISQRILFNQFHSLPKPTAPGFRSAGFRVFSQLDEDGILLYVFAKIGFASKILVDFGAGNPYGSNSANLILNWGFSGLLIEGNRTIGNQLKSFYDTHPDSAYVPPLIENVMVTTENGNGILTHHHVAGDIDLLAIDIDGLDFWVWQNLTVVSPRVVIIEAHPMWGKEISVSVPDQADFKRSVDHPDYCGASIPAMVKLGKKKGYRLVACNQYGFNLVFLRNDLAATALPEIPIIECFRFQPHNLKKRRQDKMTAVEKLEWTAIE